MTTTAVLNVLKTLVLLLLFLYSIITLYLNLPFIFLQNNTCIYIHNKENFRAVIADIVQKTRLISPITLKIYSKINHVDRKLIIGEYCFTYHDSILSIMRKIKSGNRVHHKFTIVDGWTVQTLLHHLAVAPLLNDFVLLNDTKKISLELRLPENYLEGQFYPETYDYAYPDTVMTLFQRAHTCMQKRLEILYATAETHAFFATPDQLLIAASIIQKESSDPEEQKLIASVLVNRLKLHMKLQMDPTVIYGLGENNASSLKKSDLKKDTPYNTYLHLGLPPTPICMPGETALYAAAHPKASSYLYYVSKKNGHHQFSETLVEQNLAVKKYLITAK